MTLSKYRRINLPLAAAIVLSPFCPRFVTADAGTNPKEPSRITVTVQADAPGRKISSDLIGIFFEDINYAADGGLYAELVQNRSFEYSGADFEGWNALTGWQFVTRGGKGEVRVDTADPAHPNNPHHAVLTVDGGAGLLNTGFDGIPVKAGDAYSFSLLARQTDGLPMALTVTLESKTGVVLGKATLPPLGKTWAKYPAKIAATAGDPDARLVVMASGRGQIYLDTISLFPEKTFHNRPNGTRADLGQVIADLKPKFMRFPGGCLAHGDGLGNMYRWKDTIGPIETRKEQRNIWSYHQSVGLGYHEYFQFCEDIGAKPLPVVAAGVCCQNSNREWGIGQKGLPMSEMGAWTQDILDLVEYANGPVTSTWGAKRAANGHPAPFDLEYLGVGNEDNITPVFKERFAMIYKAVKAKYPKLTVIGTVGPAPAGPDFENGWKVANELKVDMVDEHYYESPKWFLNNLTRYDSYDRNASKVYLGEYASRGNTLANALSEAAYLTGLERNGDVVHLASYAPLLGKEHHTQWNPNLIYFTNTAVNLTPNYYVQQMYGNNQGDTYLPTTISFEASKSTDPINQSTVLLGTWNTQAEFKDVATTDDANAATKLSFANAASGWTPVSGQWKVVGGSYTQSGATEPALARHALSTKQRCILTFKARKTGGSEGFLVGFGTPNSEDYYWWNVGGWRNTAHGIERVSNGVKDLVGRTVPGSIETNRWYDLKVEVVGKRVRCYLDGALVHDIADISQGEETAFAASCVKDTSTGDLIVKLVNPSSGAVRSQVALASAGVIIPAATKIVLQGIDPKTTNFYGAPQDVTPTKSSFMANGSFVYDAPPYSFTVLRMKTR